MDERCLANVFCMGQVLCMGQESVSLPEEECSGSYGYYVVTEMRVEREEIRSGAIASILAVVEEIVKECESR